MDLIKKVTNNPLPPNLLTSIRAVVNLFKNSSFHLWLQNHRVEVSFIYFCPNIIMKNTIEFHFGEVVDF